jgi:hypothetical protein
MTKRHYVSGKLVVLAATVWATIFFVACQQNQPSAPRSSAAPQGTSTDKIFIQFEGPWALAPDPNDPNSVIVIAPKATGHHDLYVKASNDMTLATGVYNLPLPAQTVTGAATDPAFVHANIPAANLQQALSAAGSRYAIRLPKPEAYVVAGRAKSRVGTTFPAPASGEGEHATAAALRYSVSTLSGWSLGGTTDTGPFNPLLLQVDAPIVRFVIEPAQMDDPTDKCETHSRESFRDLTKLLGIVLYVDFPDYTSACQSSDVQRAKKVSSVPRSLLERMAEILQADVRNGDTQRAELIVAGVDSALLKLVVANWNGTRLHSLAAALFFFAHGSADCKGPIITSP